jgi:hypothetical protein
VLADQAQHAALQLRADLARVLGLERVDGGAEARDAALALGALDLAPELPEVQ